MSMTDPIADYLTRIRNAVRAGNRRVDIPATKIRKELTRILHEQGFINDFTLIEGDKGTIIRIFLRYYENKPVIHSLDRISTPGLRRYVGVDEIPRVMNGLGIAILSTPKGILTDREARRERVGGELLCTVW
jgi:small subunit ribosomal protein S8